MMETQIRTQCDIYSYTLNGYNQEQTNKRVGNNVAKLEPLHIAYGNVKVQTICLAFPQRDKNTITI